MAQNSYDMTGKLKLEKITPVITALFGEFKLAPHGEGEAYIAQSTDVTSTSWSRIGEGLHRLVVGSLGLPAGDADDIDALLRALAIHMGLDSEAIEAVASFAPDSDDVDLDVEADIDDLFEIAHLLDDGHGLTALQAEGAWTCSRLRAGEFGGDGMYLSAHVSSRSSSCTAARLGEALDATIERADTAASAEIMLAEIDRLFGFINDPITRAAVREKTMEMLQDRSAMETAGYGTRRTEHEIMLVSLDGGETFVPARNGVRVIYQNIMLDEDDTPGEVHVNLTSEGLITDIWEKKGGLLDQNVGTACRLLDDVVADLISAQEFA